MAQNLIGPGPGNVRQVATVWLCLFLGLMLHWAGFSAWLLNLPAGGLLFVWAIIGLGGWILALKIVSSRFGCSNTTLATHTLFIRANATMALIASVLVPLFMVSFVLSVPPGHRLADGTFLGSFSVANVSAAGQRGVIAFTDGIVAHKFGWGIQFNDIRDTVPADIWHADPYVDAEWDPSQPVSVWVIHERREELTPRHQFGYIVRTLHRDRAKWDEVVAATIKKHGLRSAESALVIRLDTRPPRYKDGPTYLQALLGVYVALGIYLGFWAYASTIPAPRRHNSDSGRP